MLLNRLFLREIVLDKSGHRYKEKRERETYNATMSGVIESREIEMSEERLSGIGVFDDKKRFCATEEHEGSELSKNKEKINAPHLGQTAKRADCKDVRILEHVLKVILFFRSLTNSIGNALEDEKIFMPFL